MAEQFANLAQSTVGTAYVPASGSLVLASASSFPALGTFSVTVVDKNTGIPKMIFRVVSVSGNTLSGAAETVPGDVACNVGDFVFGTMLSAAAMAQILSEAAGGFPQTLVPPVHADFTQENFSQGNNTTTQVNNTSPVTSISILNAVGSGATAQWAWLDKAKLNATFTVTLAFSAAGDVGGSPHVGLVLTDGTKILAFALRTQGGNSYLEVQQWNTVDSFNSAPYSITTFSAIQGPLIWTRIVEDAVHRSYLMSSDGINWIMVYQEAVNTFLTTTNYGFGMITASTVVGGGFMMTAYSFSESHP